MKLCIWQRIYEAQQTGNGSVNERTVQPDCATVVHFHSRDVDWRQTTDPANRPLEFIEDSPGGYQRILSRYDKAGRLMETVTYDRSGKLRGEVSFKYRQEDASGNWTEEQVWESGTDSKAPKLRQVARRTVTYYADGVDDEPIIPATVKC